MILHLAIRNFVLIDHIGLEFVPGLNVFTGETGAGKSIIIDALNLALGARMEAGQIKDKNADCVIEAVFTIDDAAIRESPAIFPFIGDKDECLIIKREISPEGRSKNYVNQQFVNLSKLKEIGELLIDIHGQYDHQRIFDGASQLEMIDALAGLNHSNGKEAKETYRELFMRYSTLQNRKNEMLERCQGKEREIDLLKYQIDEIEKVNPQPQEAQSLKEERVHLVYAEKLHLVTSRILNVLGEGDDSASNRLSGIYRDFAEWIRIDEKAEEYKNEIDGIQLTLEELIRSIQNYQGKLHFDEERLKQIDERIEQLEWLGKKYGDDYGVQQAYLAQAREKLDQLTHSDQYQEDMDREIADALTELKKRADGLSRARLKAMAPLTQGVLRDLKELGIHHARFEVQRTKTELGPFGQDKIEFMLSPNPGEPLKPLAQIASGGEAARTMLAIKHSMAKADCIPTLIFDEIDSNVGGRLGSCVGQKLKNIANERQVILITHLPQIASFASRHIKIKKHVQNGKTHVACQVLEGNERVQELAQMMSGEKETEISKAHAKEMLKTASS